MSTSIIEAASVGIKTMADGTLRVTVDIEPSNAQAAFALFGSPGTPMALAALKVGHAIPKEPDASTTPGSGPPPKGGTLAQSAGIICNDHAFQMFAASKGAQRNADGAADLIRGACGIKSRAELDHDHAAATRFGQLMERYRDWQKQPA